MDTYLLIDSTDKAVNLIVWDGASELTHHLQGGLRLIKYAGPWGPGWAWNGTTCIDPNPPPPYQSQPTQAPPASTPSPAIRTI